jgi:hypothetical protein
MTETALRRLYGVLALLTLAPIWSARYIPTVDGPSHVYNSWVIHELIRGGNSLVAQWYAIDWRPHPNWLGHAVLALLMTIVPPLIAEKLLVSGIVLLFLYGIWLYAGCVDEWRRPFAFLAFPFAYNLPMQMGFYNFCIGAALYFIIVATWYRRRSPLLAGALLLLCYFAHPLPCALALLSVLLRPTPRLCGAVLPSVALLTWFIHTRGITTESAHYGAAGLFNYIYKSWILFTFDDRQTKLGTAIFILIAVLILITLARRRWHPLMIATILMIVVFARAPMSSSGGTMIMERMALFVILSPLAWLDARLPRRALAVLVIVLAATALIYDGYLVRRCRGASRRIAEFVRSAGAIGTNTAVLPLIRDVRLPSGTFLPVLSHAIDYALVEKHDVDAGNYEPATGYFPVKLRDGMHAADALGAHAIDFDLASYAPNGTYVFAWHVPPDAPVMGQLDRVTDTVYKVRPR